MQSNSENAFSLPAPRIDPDPWIYRARSRIYTVGYDLRLVIRRLHIGEINCTVVERIANHVRFIRFST